MIKDSGRLLQTKAHKKIFSNQGFLNTLFHELRVPISSVSGYASLFLTGELGKVSKSQIRVIRKIRELSLYAAELINNLLALSRLDTSRAVHYDKIYICDVIKRALSALNIQLHSHKLKVITRFNRAKTQIWVFPLDIEQIVINILSNAVKFTPKKGQIRVTVKKGNDSLQMSVEDTGIGIPKQALSRISEDFYRADNVVGQYEGCGLGLSIVKRLLKRNKGDISVRSELNKGTRVNITFKLLSDKEVFDYELKQHINESLRLKISFCLLMILAKTPQESKLLGIIDEAIQKNDRAYRIDADKSVVILPDSDYTEAQLVFERVRSMLQGRVLRGVKKHKYLTGPSMTMSFAVFPKDGATKEEIMSHLEQEINKPASLISGIK